VVPAWCCVFSAPRPSSQLHFLLRNLDSELPDKSDLLNSFQVWILSLTKTKYLCPQKLWNYLLILSLNTVFFLLLSLLMFPCGFGSDFVKQHCGPSAGFYMTGDCEVGWAYALLIVCTSLALYCPALANFTFYFKKRSVQGDPHQTRMQNTTNYYC
jgi:hypothetical protein